MVTVKCSAGSLRSSVQLVRASSAIGYEDHVVDRLDPDAHVPGVLAGPDQDASRYEPHYVRQRHGGAGPEDGGPRLRLSAPMAHSSFERGVPPDGAATRRTALVVTDMLNRYEHEDADRLVGTVARVLPAIVELRDRAHTEGALVVYVNDNHGDWSAGRRELCEWALAGPHARLVSPILPPSDVAFIVKARHSVFFQTQLDYMLRREDVERLVLIGQVAEQCILYSALDAYVRHYDVVVPRDAVAHIHADLASAALKMIETNMRAEVTTARDCTLT